MVYPQRAAEGSELRGWKLEPGFPHLSHFCWCCPGSRNLWNRLIFPAALRVDQSKTLESTDRPHTPLQRVKHGPLCGLKGAWSTLNLTLGHAPSSQQTRVRPEGAATAGLHCISPPACPSEGRCSHRSPCLALCWWADCIRDFPGNLLSSRLAAPSPHPPTPPSIPALAHESWSSQEEFWSAGQGLVLLLI